MIAYNIDLLRSVTGVACPNHVSRRDSEGPRLTTEGERCRGRGKNMKISKDGMRREWRGTG
jgi:hypothetical protein